MIILQEPTIKGDGEVLPAADGADVQPTEEAADPREGSSGRNREVINRVYLKTNNSTIESFASTTHCICGH